MNINNLTYILYKTKQLSIINDFKYSFKYLNLYSIILKIPNYILLNYFNNNITIKFLNYMYNFLLSTLKYNIISFYFYFNIKLKLISLRYKIYGFFNYILLYKKHSNFILIKINKNISIDIKDNTIHLKSKNLFLLNSISNKIKNTFPKKKYSKEFFIYKKYNDIK